MKQLKFMLAAATAISLATAAQAAGLSLQDFEDMGEVGTAVPADTENKKGFKYDAADDGNSSVIYQNADDAVNKTKVLNVDTAGKPLLYNINGVDGKSGEVLSGEPGETKSVVIEADVKFTVTTADQTVAAGEDDKLMIYLKKVDEVKNGDTVVTPATTKLMVKALQYRKGGYDDDDNLIAPIAEEVDCELRKAEDNSAVAVDTGTYYSLKVKSFLVDSVPMFELYLNDAKLAPPSGTKLNMDGTGDAVYYFPSLKAADSTTIQYVGFAGEGYVDNIVVTKEVNTPSTVDFTFAWTTDGISAVKYAIGVVTDETTFTDLPADTKKITGLNAADNITIQIVPAAWWAVNDDADLEYTASDASADLDDLVTKLASVGQDGTVVVESTTTPAALKINEGSFMNETAGSTELAKAVKWATSKGGATAANIGTVVGALNFEEGDEETPAEKAYLFNCSINDVDAEVANFKFPAFTPGIKPTVNAPLHGGEYNGQLKYYGADTLEGLANKVEAAAEHKFFKAVLTK